MASQGVIILLVSGLGICHLSDPWVNALDPLYWAGHRVSALPSAVGLSSG